MNFNYKAILLFGFTVMLASCDKDDVTNENAEIPQQEEAVEIRDFRFITMNRTNSWGAMPSLTYADKDNNIFIDYFDQVNGDQLMSNPNKAVHIDDKLYVVCSGSENGFYEVNPYTFETINKISLGSQFYTYDIASLGGDSVIVTGGEYNANHNLIVGSLTNETFTKSKFMLDFTGSAIKCVGSKIFITGHNDWNPYIGQSVPAKLIVLDKDNITSGGIKVIRENTNLPSRYNNILLDKNKNLWMVSVEEGTNRLLCISSQTEEILHDIALPITYFSTLRNTFYDIDNNGKYIYLRNHKAFFVVDVENPELSDEADFEYRATVGELNDLKVSDAGTLMVLNTGVGSGETSEIVEFKPTVDENWEIVSKEDVGINAVSVYVPCYVKKN